MKPFTGTAGLCAAAALLLALPEPALVAQERPVRRFEEGVFISDTLPRIRIRVDEAFAYLGNTKFVLSERAHVDRHHFVQARGDTVVRLLVFQFEGLLPGQEGGYAFRVPPESSIAGSDYRFSPEPVRLGDYEYVHNTWAFDNAASAAADPGAESARTLSFLRERGLELDDELIMSRWVRAVGEHARDEIIVFYMEPLSESESSLADFPPDGAPSAVFDSLSVSVVRRAREAFRVLSDE